MTKQHLLSSKNFSETSLIEIRQSQGFKLGQSINEGSRAIDRRNNSRRKSKQC